MKRFLKDASLLRNTAYIHGEFLTSKLNSSTYQVSDPGSCMKKNKISQDIVEHVMDCKGNDVEYAIQSASNTFSEWGLNSTAKERANILSSVANLLSTHMEDLAKILCLESGKPINEAKGEILYGASYFSWYAEQSKRGCGGEILTPDQRNRDVMTIKQPVGPAALITPWNFPNAMLARKAAAAIGAGCTVVCKPAESTPLSALALAELMHRAGAPKGVFNVVPCSREQVAEVGEMLSTHPLIRKISFTGSTNVGKLLLRNAANTIKRTSMELGGNAPFIVFQDADISLAVDGCISAKFRNNGQTCVSPNRILVHESLHSIFVEKLCMKVKNLRVGHGLFGGLSKKGTDVDLGSLINLQAVDKAKRLLQDAKDKGCDIFYQANFNHDEELQYGYFFPPTIISGKWNMDISKEEIFGPVVAIYTFSTEEEAISLANRSDAGLASYIFTRDAARISRVTKKLEYGMVGVNTGIISNALAPFGAIKNGLGREGGVHGLEDYQETKYIAIQH